MAAQQNVVGALKGGPLAIIAGVSGVALSFALVPVIARIGRAKTREIKPAPHAVLEDRK